jgi:hypothetical protein
VSPRAGRDEKNILPLPGIETKEVFFLYPLMILHIFQVQNWWFIGNRATDVRVETLKEEKVRSLCT